MDSLTLLVIAGLMIIGFFLLYYMFKQDLHLLRDSIDSTKNSVNSSLTQNNHGIQDRLIHATQVIADLKKEAGAFSEVSRSMQELHQFLRSPKLRGNIGEMVLKDLVAQMFPTSSFSLQHTFKSGEKVDLVIKTDAGLLPIDSKFPMENFQKMRGANTSDQPPLKRAFFRDIKSHVRAISGKYILPAENTLDFALMYIPSESVFYEIASADELMEYARTRRVYPVSPNTLYASLQTILLSFEGRKIETKAKEVFQLMRAISKDYEATETTLSTLGSHLNNATNKFSELEKNITSIGHKLDTTHSLPDSTLPDKNKLT